MHYLPLLNKLHSITPSPSCGKFVVYWLILFSAAPLAAAESEDGALRKACDYLWSQQAADGGWHSEQYSMLRSGQALTPFVLHALLQVPESVCPRPAGGIERALDFIRSHVDEQGAIGKSDPDILEYPIYSTAYALLCLTAIDGDERYASGSDVQLKLDMYCFLSEAQFDELEGFATTDVAYGGWGFDVAKEKHDPGHMDLAHTRRALQAIRVCVPGASWPSFTRAELFLRVVQRDPGRLSEPATVQTFLHHRSMIPFDGGFYFSPVVDAANKGRFSATHNGEAAPHFRSYATATCDGILALLAAGVERDDERVARAVEWLTAHDDYNYPQGVPTDHAEPWGEAIRFYHYAVRAEAYDALDWPGDWPARLSSIVANEQADDGSFRNAVSPLMKEDDPLLCTALAVVALVHCAK